MNNILKMNPIITSNRFAGEHRKTSLYAKAIYAINALLKKSGFDIAERCCAEALSHIRKEYWLKLGYEESKSTYWGELIGKEQSWDDPDLSYPPANDHDSTWDINGKPIVYVSQPYKISFKELKDIVQFCEKNGLEASINGESWHFPGHTILLKYTKKF